MKMKPYIPKRIILYLSDIIVITGKKERAARNIMYKVQRHFNKPRGSLITVFEFCECMGFRLEDVMRFIE